MKHIKKLNEYGSHSEAEHYEEGGLEGVGAKDILLHIYPETFIKIIRDFDKQCDENDEFKNKNMEMLKNIIAFHLKHHGNDSKTIKSMAIKYNLE